MPIPGVGARAIPLLLILLLVSDPRARLKKNEFVIFIILSSLAFFLMLMQPEKIVFISSILLAILVNHLFTVIPREWSLIPTLWIHVTAAAISLASLTTSGSDFFPNFLYGESRHGIHINPYLNFRISGIYQEPSNFGLYMLLLSIWADHAHPKSRWVGMAFSIISLLTFSSVTILAAIKILYEVRGSLRSRTMMLLLPILMLGFGFILNIFYQFFSGKFVLYQAQGLEYSRRFEILTFTLDEIKLNRFSFLSGHSATVLEGYVVYDLGPLISTILILGFAGLIIAIFFIARMRPNLLNLAIVLVTKATINNPLLWIATRRFSKPTRPHE